MKIFSCICLFFIISQSVFSQEINPQEVFSVVDTMPQYQGGDSALMKFISDNISYPLSAREDNIGGKVYVNFVVSDLGKVGKVHILKGVRADLDSAAIDVVRKLGDWIPGIRNGKKVSKERPFYGGYILIEAALVGEVPHVIKNITGVIGFLGETKGGEAVPMRLSEVNRILGKVDELTEAESVVTSNYMVGESVKVINGPFNGFNGTIEEINDEKKKIKVTVKIFGRKTPVELSFGEVEKE